MLRTILRRSFYVAAAASTLLLLAALILWPASHYRHVYALYVTAGDPVYFLAADSGRAYGVCGSGFGGSPGWHFAAAEPEWSHWRYLTWNTPDPELGSSAHAFLGVSWFHIGPGAGQTYDVALIPCSYLAGLSAILPLLAFRSIRRRRTAAKDARIGLCPKCGYDLRTQQSGAGAPRCPECGTPVVRC